MMTMPQTQHTRRTDGRGLRAFTLAELLIAVALSAVVMMAAFALVPAYAYSSSEINDLRPLRTESVNLHALVHNWLRSTSDILAPIPGAPGPTYNEPGVSTVIIFAWMGDEPGQAYDGNVQADEIEALKLVRTWDDSVAYKSELKWYSYTANRTNVTNAALGDANHVWLIDTWLAGADQEVQWSSNVYEFTPEVTAVNSKNFAEINVALKNFEPKEANPSLNMPTYSFQIVGGPDTYVQAQGS